MPFEDDHAPKVIIGMIIFEGAAEIEECLHVVRVELVRLNVRTCIGESSHGASERIASGEPGS